MLLIDTHAHLNFNVFKDDTDQVIKRALKNNIWMINVGSQYTTSKRSIEITNNYPEGVYAAVGLHPIHLETGLVKVKNDKEEVKIKSREEEFDYKKYKKLAENQKVVAIGEIGLDYYWKPKTTKKKELFKAKQKDAFLKQLGLARELNLPVIFHCRMAHQDLIDILSFQFSMSDFRLEGVVHCFTGTWDQAQKYLEMGFYLGFNGLIFKMDFDEIIKKTPLQKILVETDCPYLTPPPAEGRNEPLNVKYVAEKIAKLKNVKYEKIAEITTENAKKLFKL